MKELSSHKDEQWGFRLNRYQQGSIQGAPSWAMKLQREKLEKSGLVLWNQETKTVTHLTAAQALHLLNRLKENNDWKHGETVIGEPATRISLDEPDREPEQVLTNKIYLTPDKIQSLLDTLERHKPDLEVMKKEEEERGRVLARVYRYILDLGRKKKEDSTASK